MDLIDTKLRPSEIYRSLEGELGVLRKHWPSILGGLDLFYHILRGFADGVGLVDTALEHIPGRDQTWLGKLEIMLLHPPGWVILLTISMGLALIWWDIRRSRNDNPSKIRTTDEGETMDRPKGKFGFGSFGGEGVTFTNCTAIGYEQGFRLENERGSVVRNSRAEIRPVAAAQERDIWLQEAIYFATHGHWLGENEKAFPNEAYMNRAAEIAMRMRQMAADGTFTIWGIAARGQAYQRIPRDFWIDQQIDIHHVLTRGDEPHALGTEPSGAVGKNRGHFTSLMVSKAAVEEIWPA